MKIVADENIPLLTAFFEHFGELETFPGREISTEHVRDADILLVRSVTQVDKALLEGSAVKFVGTATIGIDHIDCDYLLDRQIGFASAPGCNANAVVEYVLSVLSVLSEWQSFRWQDKRVAIIGHGNVGSRLSARLKQCGVDTLCYDPYLAQGDSENYVSFDDALQADIISIHTPLTKSGDFPTYHMFGEQQLAQLADNVTIINTARGGVIDNCALKHHVRNKPQTTAVLDVWENEPNIDLELLPLVRLATPHIAGYSLDGKMRGTEMLYQQLSRFLGLPMRKKLEQIMPEAPLTKMAFSTEADSRWATRTALRACYDVRRDDQALRWALLHSQQPVAKAFDQLRRNYPVRREFHTVKVQIKNKNSNLYTSFKQLGFKVKS